MMAAAQPFISGAISKTINMPNEVSVGEIEEAYLDSWKMSLKAVALYRDGSKLSQPLNTSSDDDTSDDPDIDDLKAETTMATGGSAAPAPVAHVVTPEPVRAADPIERIVVKIVERPLRRRLPDTRASVTHKFDIAGHEGYITVGLFEDNTPGEVFIIMAKQGSTIGGLMDTVATLISLNLQYGVPIDAIVRKFEHMRFEPAGMTANPDIPFAKSFIDYVVRWMGMQFMPGYRAANAPKRESQMAPEVVAPTLLDEPLLDRGDVLPTSSPDVSSGDHGHGNGHTKGGSNGGTHTGTSVVSGSRKEMMLEPAKKMDPLSQQTARMMGDAPTCTCGAITIRNGSCYKCLNCGASLGCS